MLKNTLIACELEQAIVASQSSENPPMKWVNESDTKAVIEFTNFEGSFRIVMEKLP